MVYDPNAPGMKGSLFGLPFGKEESEIIIYPVPWDVTASYHAGAADGPQAILDASTQLDLEIPGQDAPWKRGIWMHPISEQWRRMSCELRVDSCRLRDVRDDLINNDPGHFNSTRQEINRACLDLKSDIKTETLNYLKEGKKVGLLGGDHSCALGYLEALAEVHDDFGILQIDAHMDLRKSYEGFDQSHASIMYNAMNISNIPKLVQVGVRDYCEEEIDRINLSNGRIEVFYDQKIRAGIYQEKKWGKWCRQIVDCLPSKVYISFDIDGLNPHLCPGTGTPVPGGLEFNEAIYLMEQIAISGREVIGFDLCEVTPQANDKEWNANVGARLLYRLCGVLGD